MDVMRMVLNSLSASVKQAQVNKHQCQRLCSRLQALQTPLQKLQNGATSSSQQIKSSLWRVRRLADEAKDFMAEFAGEDWIARAATRAADATRFQGFAEDIVEAIEELQLQVPMDDFVDREVDQEDEQADFEEFEAKLEQAQQALGEVNEASATLTAEVRERHMHIMQALNALRASRPASLAGVRELAFRELHFASRIATNLSGEVWLGGWHGAPVAIKRLKQKHMSRDELVAMKDELLVHQHLRNSFVVQLVGACTVQPALCLVTEYAQHGSLHEFVHAAKEDIPLRLRLAFLHDIARGMTYLHRSGILHARLKTNNLLLFENFRVRVADFGLPCIAATKQNSPLNNETNSANADSRWISPELLLAQPRHEGARAALVGTADEEMLNAPTNKVDLFSFAMVIYELWVRKVPFFNILRNDAVEATILRGDRPMLPSAAERQCPAANDIMERCWNNRPSQRPEFAALTSEVDKLLTAEGRDPRAYSETKLIDLRTAAELLRRRCNPGGDISEVAEAEVSVPNGNSDTNTEAVSPTQSELTSRDPELKRREESTSENGSSLSDAITKLFGGADSTLTGRLLAEDNTMFDQQAALAQGLAPNDMRLKSLDSMYIAALRGSVAEVPDLRMEGFSAAATIVQDNGMTPCHKAAHRGHLEVLKVLCEVNRMNPSATDARGRTALHYACMGGHLPTVQYLLDEQGMNPLLFDSENLSAVHRAVIAGASDVTTRLLRFGSSAKMLEDPEYGGTLLHWACVSGRFELVQSLVEENRAELEKKAFDNTTPLFWACVSGDDGLVAYLLNKGARTNRTDNAGATCLHYASVRGSTGVVQLLVEKGGMNVLAKDYNGETPLSVCTNDEARAYLQGKMKWFQKQRKR